MVSTPHRPWTPADDARLRELRAAGVPWSDVAAALGRTYAASVARGTLLGVCAKRNPRWTGAEDFELLSLLERHRPFPAIARLLGRTVVAVRARASELGAKARTANGQPVADVARLLGVGREVVNRWIRHGWLRAHTVGARRGRGTLLIVEREDLEAFLADERRWHLVDPARVADPVLRDWATEVRRGLTFLDTEEAGRRLGLTRGHVDSLAREGRIRSVKDGHRVVIRSDWLIYPAWKPAIKGARQVTPADHALIRQLWGQVPATTIARRLGCKSEVGVVKAARAMGLPPLGRGYWRRRGARKESAA